MRKSVFLLAVFLLLVAACGRNGQQQGTGGSSVQKQQFTTEVLLKTTPVKNQGKSQLCWVHAMLATIESEHLMMGDSVNLSPDFIARHTLSELADRYYMKGEAAKPSLRGMATMLLNRLQRYGMLAYDTYHATDDTNYNVLLRKLTKTVGAARARQEGLAECRKQVERLLDDAIRPVPRYQFMFGAEYTTQEFAHSVCRQNEYEALTSFSHHPFGERFELELTDNRDGDKFLNVPIDQLLRRVVAALRGGHAVCWEGDVSEPGFSFARGLAVLPSERSGKDAVKDSLSAARYSQANDLQQQRQRMFERFQTTDDHCMALVGIAHDTAGNPYFVCKNSWGTDNPYGGMMYMSFDYFLLKTICVVLPCEAQ